MIYTLSTDHSESSQGSVTSYNRLLTVLLVSVVLLVGWHTTFGQTTGWNTLSTGSRPISIISTDIDGILGRDLIVIDNIPSEDFARACTQGNKEGGTVTLFSGLGDGSFAIVSETRLGRALQANTAATQGGFNYRIDDYAAVRPRSSVVGDFDGDGKNDLLVLDYVSPRILIFTGPKLDTVKFLNWNRFQQSMNVGDLEFEYDATSIAAADFDRDGRLDLVITRDGSEGEDTVSVYHNEGSGDFSKSVGWPLAKSGASPYCITIDDIDNDGNKDIIIARAGYLAVNIVVINGNGDGSFHFTQQAEYRVGRTSKSVQLVTGDFNSDGNEDVLLAGEEQILFLAGTGQEDHLFQAKKMVALWNSPSDIELPIGMVAEDFNHDHNLDFAIADPSNDCVRVYLGNGDGSFTEGKRLLLGEGWQPVSLGTDDINGDMYPDLMIGGNAKNGVCIFLNHGSSGFNKVAWPRVGTGVTSLTPGNFNHDTNPDFAAIHLLPKYQHATFISTTEKARIGGKEYSAGDALVYPAFSNFFAQIDLFVSSTLDGQNVSYSNTPIPLDAGQGIPRDVIAQDLNADGIDDLVISIYDKRYILVDLSTTSDTQGQPQFSGWQKYQVGWYPTALLSADWNADQHHDLAVVNFGSDNISILLNNGTGSFREVQRAQVGHRPKAATVGDFNSDGKQDLVVTYEHASNVSLLLGKGDGTFEAQHLCDVGYPDCELLASGDFDRENGPDLAVGTVSGNILILINNGDGTFAIGSTYSTTGDLRSLATIDNDGDGKLDLLVAGCSGGLHLWRGVGDGTFAKGGQIKSGINIIGTLTEIVHPSSIAVAGNQVIVGTEFPVLGESIFPDDIVILSGSGSSPRQVIKQPTYSQALDIAAADFNCDQVPDIAILLKAKDGAMKLVTLMDPGITSPLPPATTFEGNVENASFLKAGDMDGDSLLDIAVASTTKNTVHLLWGQGNGSFDPSYLSLKTVVAPAAMEMLGNWGLVVASMEIDVFIPNTDISRTFIKVSLNTGDCVSAIAARDLNGDGYPDLVVAGMDNQKIQVFSGEDIIRATRDPSAAVNPVTSLWIDGLPSALCIGQFGTDPYFDLAVALVDRDRVQILHGTGGFNFTWGGAFAVGRAPVAMKSGYINNDPYQDLIVGNADSRDLSLLLGEGDGDFSAGHTSTINLTSSPKKLVIADWNMDEKDDIGVVYNGTNGISLLYNTSEAARPLNINGIAIEQGTFTPPPWSPTRQPSVAPPTAQTESNTTATSPTRSAKFVYQGEKDVETALINADNIPDIVLTCSETDTVSILLGTGTRNHPFVEGYTTVLDVPIEGSPAIGDFDGDLQTDIAVISPSLNELIVLWGNGTGQTPTQSVIPTGVVPIEVVSADFNGDNIDDLAVLCQGAHEILICIDKAGRKKRFETTSIKVLETPMAFVVADVNNDGLSDLVVSTFPEGKMLIFTANATEDGTLDFSLDSKQLSTGIASNIMLAADLNNDRANDLVVFGPEAQVGLILYNTNYGQFSQSSSQTILCNAVDAELSDFNSDQYLDLIVTDGDSGLPLIYLGLGDGTLSGKPIVYFACQHSYSLVSGDFDLDNNLDLVITDRSGGIWMLWRKGDDSLLEKEPVRIGIE